MVFLVMQFARSYSPFDHPEKPMDEVRIPTYTPSYLLKRCADFIIAIRRVDISQPLALARLLDCDWRL